MHTWATVHPIMALLLKQMKSCDRGPQIQITAGVVDSRTDAQRTSEEPHGSGTNTPAARQNPRQGTRQRRVDDASRDTNHAVAHLFCGEVGLLLLVLFYHLGVLHSCWQTGKDEAPLEKRNERRVGNSSARRVRFSPHLESLTDDSNAKETPAVKQGIGDKPCRSPKAVKDLLGHKAPQLGLRLKNRQDYQQEAVNVALDRLALTTRRMYAAQLKWWRLFFARRQVHWLLTGVPADEDLLIDYLLHCAINEQRAPGTLKLRLAAVRSIHVTLGLPNPLEGRNRVAMALAGLRRRYKTPTRRAPVTPRNWKSISAALIRARRVLSSGQLCAWGFSSYSGHQNFCPWGTSLSLAN